VTQAFATAHVFVFSSASAGTSVSVSIVVDRWSENIDDTFDFFLSKTQLDQLKENRCCIDGTSCNMTVFADWTDGAGNYNEITTLVCSSFSRDTISPRLVSFPLFNLTSGHLTLIFSEPIDEQSFIAHRVAMRSFFSRPLSQRILSSFSVSSLPNNTLELQVSHEDLMAIRADDFLCKTESNCWIGFDGGAFADVSGNLGSALPGISVDSLSLPTLSPTLREFSMSMDSAWISFTFDVPVNNGSVDASRITLQDAASANLSYSLTSLRCTSSLTKLALFCGLNSVDLENLKASMFGKTRNSTYLTAQVGFVSDTTFPVGNSARAIIDGNGLQVSTFFADRTSPLLFVLC